MQLTLHTELLQNQLKLFSKLIPSKPQLPILSGILISADTSTITFSSTDLFVGLKITIAAKVEEPGTLVVPGKQFIEIITSMSGGVVQLHTTDTALRISNDSADTTLSFLSAEDFPEFPHVSGEVLTLSKEQLDTITSYVVMSASSDQARPTLTAVLFDVKESPPRAVATDGFRLSLLELPNLRVDQEPFLVPARLLTDVSRMMQVQSESEIECQVDYEQKAVLFQLGQLLFFVRMIDGQFPPYQKIIPETFSTTLECSIEELLEHCKRALIFSRDNSDIIQLHLSTKETKIVGTATATGKYEGSVLSGVVTGEDVDVAFNARYIIDLLQASKTGQLSVSVQEPLKPTLWHITDVPELRYIVMPFRLNG